MRVWLKTMVFVLGALAIGSAVSAEPVAEKKACAFDEEREGDLCYPRCKTNYVGDGDECSLLSSAFGDAPEAHREVAVLGPHGCPGCFDER